MDLDNPITASFTSNIANEGLPPLLIAEEYDTILENMTNAEDLYETAMNTIEDPHVRYDLSAASSRVRFQTCLAVSDSTSSDISETLLTCFRSFPTAPHSHPSSTRQRRCGRSPCRRVSSHPSSYVYLENPYFQSIQHRRHHVGAGIALLPAQTWSSPRTVSTGGIRLFHNASTPILTFAGHAIRGSGGTHRSAALPAISTCSTRIFAPRIHRARPYPQREHRRPTRSASGAGADGFGLCVEHLRGLDDTASAASHAQRVQNGEEAYGGSISGCVADHQ